MESFSKADSEIKYPFRSLACKSTIILGDLSSGKTTLTAKIVVDALRSENPSKITVIDLAPEKALYSGKILGGRIAEIVKLSPVVRVLQPKRINAPRYSARNSRDLLRQVEENRIIIEEVIDIYIKTPTPILFVNDLSLYLQSGEHKKVFKLIKEAETFVANAYYGRSLEADLGTGISAVERQLVEEVARQVDLLIHL